MVGAAAVRRARSFVCSLDPRTKLVLLVLVGAASVVAEGLPRLLGVLAVAAAWVVVAGAPVGSGRRLLRLAVAVGVVAAALAAWSWGRGGLAGQVVEPLARLAPLLLAGWAFSASTPPGQLALGLQRMHFPRSVVLVAVAARSLVPVLTAEVRMGCDAARRKLAEAPGSRLAALPRTAWRALVALSVRLIQRADLMAAAAELRAVARPGTRSSLHPVGCRLRDLAVALAASGGLAALWAL